MRPRTRYIRVSGSNIAALLCSNAKGRSSATISRLNANCWNDYEAWQKQHLSTRRFLYVWADGGYFKLRMEDEKQCVLVVVGADEWEHKELLGMTDAFARVPRASSRRCIRIACRARGGSCCWVCGAAA